MRFGLFWQTPGSEESSVSRRHWETIEEIVLGEQLGFESTWLALKDIALISRFKNNKLLCMSIFLKAVRSQCQKCVSVQSKLPFYLLSVVKIIRLFSLAYISNRCCFTFPFRLIQESQGEFVIRFLKNIQAAPQNYSPPGIRFYPSIMEVVL